MKRYKLVRINCIVPSAAWDTKDVEIKTAVLSIAGFLGTTLNHAIAMRSAQRTVYPEGEAGPKVQNKITLAFWCTLAGLATALVEQTVAELTNDGRVFADDLSLKVLVDGTRWETFKIGKMKADQIIEFKDLEGNFEFQSHSEIVIQLWEDDILRNDNLFTGKFEDKDGEITVHTASSIEDGNGFYILTLQKLKNP